MSIKVAIIEMGESGEAGSNKVGQEEEELEETDSPSKGGDGNGCSTLCNIFIKFTLFLTNFIMWVSAHKQKILMYQFTHINIAITM